MFQFYISIRGRLANWIVSIVFMLVGGLIAVIVPALLQPSPDRGTVVLILRILGGVFLGLGLLIYVWMLGDWYLKSRDQETREKWYWWGNFLLPMLAAGLFAVPSILAFPVIFSFYLSRPNGLFPAGSLADSQNLMIGGIFSVAGLLALALMYFIGKAMLKSKPGQRASGHKARENLAKKAN
jgi:MFS family permease